MHIISAITVIVRKMHGEIRGSSGNFANTVMPVIAPWSKGEEPVSANNPPEPLGFGRLDKCAVVGDLYNYVWSGDSFELNNLAPHGAVPSSSGPLYEVAYLSYIGGCRLLIQVSVNVSYFKHSVERPGNRFVFIRLDFLFNYYSFFFSQHINWSFQAASPGLSHY